MKIWILQIYIWKKNTILLLKVVLKCVCDIGVAVDISNNGNVVLYQIFLQFIILVYQWEDSVTAMTMAKATEMATAMATILK
jgi:hypothetical protein